MFKQEMAKVFKSPRSIIIFAYFLLVAIGENISAYSLWRPGGGYDNAHPAYMSLLSGAGNIIFPALFFWLLPILLVLLYCGRYNEERKKNLNYVYISNVGRKKFFLSKLGTSFVLPIIYTGIPLLINLGISVALMHGGTSFTDIEKWPIEEFTLPGETFVYWSVHHPYLGWGVYFLAAMFVFGLVGVMTQSIAMIANDNRIALVGSFAIWIIYFSIDFSFNIVQVIEPYAGNGPYYGLRALLVFLPVVIISVVVAYIMQVKRKDIV